MQGEVDRRRSLELAGGIMPWWSWMIIGTVLMGTELLLVDLQFFLVFMGLAALVVGIATLAGLGGPEWVQWLVFGVLALAFMFGFRKRLYEKLRGSLPGYEAALVGQLVQVPAGLAAHASGRLEFRGSTWNVRNDGAEPIEPGGRARIERAEGLTLYLRRA